MPKRGEYINMWDNKGKKFSGKVIQCRGKKHFFIIEAGTNARVWIDLDRLNCWSYQEGEKTPVMEDETSHPRPSLYCLGCIPFSDEVDF
jgi:hypothetical protein